MISLNTATVKALQPVRDAIHQQVEDYLRAGGVIEQLESGERVESIRTEHGFTHTMVAGEDVWQRGTWRIKRRAQCYQAQRVPGAPFVVCQTFDAAVKWLETGR